MKFEWDENKNIKNIKKHGISFKQASRVFLDPNAIIIPDPFEEEERWNAIGMIENVVFVVYTERDSETIRIISARRATKEEVNGYKENDFRRT